MRSIFACFEMSSCWMCSCECVQLVITKIWLTKNIAFLRFEIQNSIIVVIILMSLYLWRFCCVCRWNFNEQCLVFLMNAFGYELQWNRCSLIGSFRFDLYLMHYFSEMHLAIGRSFLFCHVRWINKYGGICFVSSVWYSSFLLNNLWLSVGVFFFVVVDVP